VQDNKDMNTASFKGPFSFLKGQIDSILEVPEGKMEGGIYIWTIQCKNMELIHYVGQTSRTFAQRMKEHLYGYLSGKYPINDPKEIFNEKKEIWKGWPKAKVEDFIVKHDKLWGAIIETIRSIRIYVWQSDVDEKIRKRIEAAICLRLEQEAGMAGKLLDNKKQTKRNNNEALLKIEVVLPKEVAGMPMTIDY